MLNAFSESGGLASLLIVLAILGGCAPKPQTESNPSVLAPKQLQEISAPKSKGILFANSRLFGVQDSGEVQPILLLDDAQSPLINVTPLEMVDLNDSYFFLLLQYPPDSFGVSQLRNEGYVINKTSGVSTFAGSFSLSSWSVAKPREKIARVPFDGFHVLARRNYLTATDHVYFEGLGDYSRLTNTEGQLGVVPIRNSILAENASGYAFSNGGVVSPSGKFLPLAVNAPVFVGSDGELYGVAPSEFNYQKRLLRLDVAAIEPRLVEVGYIPSEFMSNRIGVLQGGRYLFSRNANTFIRLNVSSGTLDSIPLCCDGTSRPHSVLLGIDGDLIIVASEGGLKQVFFLAHNGTTLTKIVFSDYQAIGFPDIHSRKIIIKRTSDGSVSMANIADDGSFTNLTSLPSNTDFDESTYISLE